MPRPYPRSLADHPAKSHPRPFSLFFSLFALHHPPLSSPRRALTLFIASIRVASNAIPALRRLKHAVDKKQVWRMRQGADAGWVQERVQQWGKQWWMTEKEREKLSRDGVISILFFLLPLFSTIFSPPFRPVSLSTIRYISTHPRHCFRGISSELFARDSFREATRRLILLQCLFPSLRDIAMLRN